MCCDGEDSVAYRFEDSAGEQSSLSTQLPKDSRLVTMPMLVMHLCVCGWNACWCVRGAGQEVDEEPMMGYEAAMKEISVHELAGGEGEFVVGWENLP